MPRRRPVGGRSPMILTPESKYSPAAFQGLFQIGGLTFPEDRLVVVAIALIALGAFWLFVRFTRIGLAVRTVGQDREIAEAQGIDTRATYRITFFLATMLAGLGGRCSPRSTRCPRTRGSCR